MQLKTRCGTEEEVSIWYLDWSSSLMENQWSWEWGKGWGSAQIYTGQPGQWSGQSWDHSLPETIWMIQRTHGNKPNFTHHVWRKKKDEYSSQHYHPMGVETLCLGVGQDDCAITMMSKSSRSLIRAGTEIVQRGDSSSSLLKVIKDAGPNSCWLVLTCS